MERKRILVFSSGTANGGGLQFSRLVQLSRGENPVLEADVVAVVSDNPTGDVRMRAFQLGVAFEHMVPPHVSIRYQWLLQKHRANYAVFCDWSPVVEGLDPETTIRIDGCVYEAVLASLRERMKSE